MIILTTYYNPCKYTSRINNYLRFKKELEKNKLNLITLELASKEEDFEIKDSIKFIASPNIWQKECLISKALEIYPNEEKFAWLDCDIIFENKNWYDEAKNLLDEYDVIQLFDEVNFLGKNNIYIDISFKSTIFEFYNNKKFKDGHPNQGHPGFAWAAKRKFINFYKENFIFSGDVIFSSSLTKNFWIINSWKIPFDLKESIIKWCLNNNHCKFTYLTGKVGHLRHGCWKNRQYNKRLDIVNFYKEIKMKNGFFECENEKINFIFKNYFKKRNDDEKYFI